MTFQASAIACITGELFAGIDVLLVEDYEHNRLLIELVLKQFNCHVTTAVVEALEKVDNANFDIIFMDIQMPVMDGIEAFKRLRIKNTDVPVVALTANNMQHEIDKYFSLGFNDYLSKPVSKGVTRCIVRSQTKIENSELVSPISPLFLLKRVKLYQCSDSVNQKSF